MRIISVDELGVNWPRLLSQLAEGEEFLLTEAGRPVGRMLPPLSLPADSVLSPTEWEREFRDWMQSMQQRTTDYPPGYAADDSRASIYRGHGE